MTFQVIEDRTVVVFTCDSILKTDSSYGCEQHKTIFCEIISLSMETYINVGTTIKNVANYLPSYINIMHSG